MSVRQSDSMQVQSRTFTQKLVSKQEVINGADFYLLKIWYVVEESFKLMTVFVVESVLTSVGSLSQCIYKSESLS